MDSLALLVSPAYAPFTGALLAVIVILATEVTLTALAGSGLSDILDSLIETHSLPDSSFTNWLLVKELPMLIVICSLLASFGICGLLLQGVLTQALHLPLSLLGALAAVRAMAKALSGLKLVHSSAVSPASFIGQRVTLNSPQASQGYAGAASFIDRYGATHTLMVEPTLPDVTYTAGEVLTVAERVSIALYRVSK
jgi:ABC-type multidrug transport system fused ATPase/permease subunit